MTIAGSLVLAFSLTSALLAGLWLLRRAVHRGLAPERIIGTQTPADFGLAYENVRIPTANQKSLFGWWIPARNTAGANAGRTVIALHGWSGNSSTMLVLAKPLHDAGFALLLIDARCHGRSDEDDFTSLPRFAEDLEYAIDWLRSRQTQATESVAVIGHSVGAAAVLLAASRRADITAVVSIAAFTHPVAMMRRWFVAHRIPFRPIGWLMLHYVEHVIGKRFDCIAPINTITRINCPTLILHGSEDRTVPATEARAIHAARSGEHVRLRIIAGSHDDFASSADLDNELAVLTDFLCQACGAETAAADLSGEGRLRTATLNATDEPAGTLTRLSPTHVETVSNRQHLAG